MTVVALADVLEKEWQAQVLGLAKTLGWNHIYHTHDSRSSAHGFPDLVMARDRIVFVELKREKTKPTAEQVGWLDKLASAGAEVYVWRPSDLAEIGRVLSTRSILQRLPGSHELYSPETDEWWRPGSLWTPGVGRADTIEASRAAI